ncbi:MAG: uracil-DNA glycosylase [Elusimicrobia bacterium]|nr:uracil-DNA glycosylase [Elusimicrobiota bacterium]
MAGREVLVRESTPRPTQEKADGAKEERLAALAARISACRLCGLGASRLNAVPGVGSAEARVMFIGEGPGFDEDHKGEPFVGRSGQLLDKIMESIGLSRKTVYIANTVKCHPMKDASDPEARGNDRPPSPEEMAACRPYLDEQIRIIEPKIIVTLGASAAKAMLGDGLSITKIRGQWRQYTPEGGAPVKLMPTFHPAALLRDPNLKKDVWTDMKNLKKELEAQ